MHVIIAFVVGFAIGYAVRGISAAKRNAAVAAGEAVVTSEVKKI